MAAKRTRYFGMELGGYNVASSDRGDELSTVVAHRSFPSLWGMFEAIGVGEIGVSRAEEELIRGHVVPAEVGHARTFLETFDGFLHNAKAHHTWAFFAGIAQELHAEADRKRRLARLDSELQRSLETLFSKGVHAGFEGANSRQDDGRILEDFFRGFDEFGFDAKFGEGGLDGGDVGDSSIDDGDDFIHFQ